MKLEAEVCKAFSTSASQYDDVAVIQREIGDRLFERLTYLAMRPTVVLDLGCGTGVWTQQLQQRYPDALVMGLDYACPMLGMAKERTREARFALLHANMMHCPIARNSVDLIFANQVVHWSLDMAVLFKEVMRILKPGGCFFFSTLGPDTFFELKETWSRVDKFEHVFSFPDMHDVGDQLMAHGFLDPVVDREDLVAHYASFMALVRGLKAQGVRNMHGNRRTGLTGKKAWQEAEQVYNSTWLTATHKAPLRYEIIYGHAWKGQPRSEQRDNEVWISVDQLKRRSDESIS